MPFDLRPAEACRWDLVALGEVMLRLDPGEGRIAATRTFQSMATRAEVEALMTGAGARVVR